MPKHSRSRNESLMLRYLSDILAHKVHDKALGFTTINAVEVTSDYSYAKVFVSFLGDGDPIAKVAILQNAAGFIRRELAQKMESRKIPELRFVYDDTLEKAAKIEEILKKALK